MKYLLYPAKHNSSLLRTHRPWSWIRDPPLVLHPAIIGPLLMSKRPVEGGSDGGHGIDANG